MLVNLNKRTMQIKEDDVVYEETGEEEEAEDV